MGADFTASALEGTGLTLGFANALLFPFFLVGSLYLGEITLAVFENDFLVVSLIDGVFVTSTLETDFRKILRSHRLNN